MPNATIYVRRINQAAWDALEDKSAWINNHLKDLRTTTDVTSAPVAEPVAEPTEKNSIATQLDDDFYDQLIEQNLEYLRPGVVWSSDKETELRYQLINGKVVI